MLGDITVADEIYVICGYTDMRKSIDGLCAVVKDQLNMDPSRPNAIYLFCGRRSDRIKVLLHEREGFVLLYKRLDANVGNYPSNHISTFFLLNLLSCLYPIPHTLTDSVSYAVHMVRIHLLLYSYIQYHPACLFRMPDQ